MGALQSHILIINLHGYNRSVRFDNFQIDVDL